MMGYKIFLAAVLSLPLTGVFAHGGEDHGEAQALPTNTRSLPSAEAKSSDFELFTQLQGDTLTVYLDSYSDNQPVLGANIEVESDSFKATLQAVAPGTYQGNASALNHPGEHSLLFTVVAGEQSDLLDTVLSVTTSAATEHAHASRRLWWLGGVLAALAIAVLLFTRRQCRVLRNHGASAL
ncbi:MAG: hypothetical protein K2X80_05555 [Pseudomonadaceae bacterium]|nr:hypothetical protein [Pseudomonadaceae bacterium]